MNRDSQYSQILRLLKRGMRLTPLNALKLAGTLSLSQRCGELRRAGHKVKSRMVRLPSGKRIASYSL